MSKWPLLTLPFTVEQQYTMPRRQAAALPSSQRHASTAFHLRVMGNSPSPSSPLYFVATDLCLLLGVRKGNVAKTIGQYLEHEKARMNVVCQRKSGITSTQLLTVLTIQGARRLLCSSRRGGEKAAPLWHALQTRLEEMRALRVLHGEEGVDDVVGVAGRDLPVGDGWGRIKDEMLPWGVRIKEESLLWGARLKEEPLPY